MSRFCRTLQTSWPPYGKGPKAALEKTLEMAAAMGLKTRNCEDHIGYAELEGAEP